jgi:hypothetical protein
MSPRALKELIIRTGERFREIDSAEPYSRSYTEKWEQAAREIAPAEWAEYVRILAQGWDYYGGSDLSGEVGQ